MKISKRKIIIFTAVFFFLFLFIYVQTSTSGNRTYSKKPMEYNINWQYTENKDDLTLLATHELDKELKGNTLSFYTNDSFVNVYIDDKEIYSFGEHIAFGKSPSSHQHFVTIPDNYPGDKLIIKVTTAYKNKFLTSYNFILGNYSDIIVQMMKQEATNIITNFIIGVIGVLLFIIYITTLSSGVRKKSSLYLGLCSITFAIWSNSTLLISELIIGNALTEYYINYFTLFLLPVFLMLYLESIFAGINNKISIHMIVIVELILTALHIFNICDYTESIKVYVGFIALIAIVFVGINYKKIEIKNNNTQKVATIILASSIILNVLVFIFKTTFGNHSLYSKIGFSIYLIISLYNALKQTVTDLALVKESEKLKEIAFTDKLTQIGNRYSFDEDIISTDLSELGLVSIDLNNLKYYNDNFGHSYGDTLISDASVLLSSIYKRVYRVGGDEFVAILKGDENDKYEEYYTQMHEKIKEYNASGKHSIILNIASGFSSYEKTDVTYNSILNRADKNMYKDKAKLKQSTKLSGNNVARN